MWQIINKNYRQYGLFLLFFCGTLAAVRFLIGNELSVVFVLIGGMSLFVSIIGVIFIGEQYEEKHHGYALMEILPIKRIEIVAAKFLLALVMCVLLTAFLVVLFSLSEAQSHDLRLVRSYLLLMGSCALLLAGIMYIGIFAIGYTKFLIGVLCFTTAMGLVPAILMNNQQDDVGIFIERLLDWLQNMNWSGFLAIVLVAYLGLMWIAAQVKSIRSNP